MCSLVKPVENDDSHIFSQSPSPCSPHFKLPGFFILYPIDTPATCLWEGGCETSDLLAWLVQFSSVSQSCLILCNPVDCSTPGFPVHPNSWSLLKLMSIESVMPSNHLILCRPLLLMPSIFPSIRVFSNESVLRIRWPKLLKFQLQYQSFQ